MVGAWGLLSFRYSVSLHYEGVGMKMKRVDKLKIVQELMVETEHIFHKHFHYDEAMFNEKDNIKLRKLWYSIVNLVAYYER